MPEMTPTEAQALLVEDLYIFDNATPLVPYEIFKPTHPVCGEKSYYVRGTCSAYGGGSTAVADHRGRALSQLTTTPWNAAELEAIEEQKNAYLRSMSCEPSE